MEENFNQQMVFFDFHLKNALTKQKNVLKLFLFADKKTPDEAVSYTLETASKAFESTFNTALDMNSIRIKKIQFLEKYNKDDYTNSPGLTQKEQVKFLSKIYKKHFF